MSKNEFFDQLFQLTGPDTQRKSCSSWKMLHDNVVDEVDSLFLHWYPLQTKKSKNFKKSPTSRVQRFFSMDQNRITPTVLECWLLIFLFATISTGRPPRVKIKYYNFYAGLITKILNPYKTRCWNFRFSIFFSHSSHVNMNLAFVRLRFRESKSKIRNA